MEYYELLGLSREPFNDTADPYFLFESRHHRETLQRLEISVRLGRGLNLVFGDVGSGKTTLSQALEQSLLQEDSFCFGKVLDPSFASEVDFLEHLRLIFSIPGKKIRSPLSGKNLLKHFLFQKGVEEGKTVVLIIDEGQKLTPPHLETLRLLLNYQTPQKKLLNIIIFSQLELLSLIQNKPNFTDRIAVLQVLPPLSREETHQMIAFRLKRAGLQDGKDLYTAAAKDLIFRATQGRPRKITLLCHNSIEEAIIRDKTIVDEGLVSSILEQERKIEESLTGKEEPSLLQRVLNLPGHLFRLFSDGERRSAARR